MVLITLFLRYFVKADYLTELSVAFLAILSPITAKYSLKCCDISIESSTVLLSICNFMGGDLVLLGGITALISFQSSFELFFLSESVSL